MRIAGSAGTENTAIPMVGVPAVTTRADGGFDVFFRDPKSILTYATNTGAAWTTTSMGMLAITDPVLAPSGLERVDIAALTTE